MVGQKYDNVYVKLYTSLRKNHGSYNWGTIPSNSLFAEYDSGYYYIAWCIDFAINILSDEDVLPPGVYKLESNDMEIEPDALFVYSN